MKILTNDSLFQLKKLFKEDVDIVNKPFNEIVEQNKLVLIDRYVLDENIKLVETGDQEKNDYTNSGLIFQSLKNLSPADATDERLWTTLCFNQYKSYILKRWPDISNGKHFFCEGNRSLTRDNGTARLWWMQFNLKKMNSLNNDVAEAFFENRDRREGIIERPTSASNDRVLRLIFEIITEKKLTRNQYRPFYNKINFIGKRKNLLAMDDLSLKKILMDYL